MSQNKQPKTLKLDHELAQLVLVGQKTSTWRLYDDKAIAVDDEIELIDKVDPKDPTSWLAIGRAKVKQVTEKYLGDVGGADFDGHEGYSSEAEMYELYRRYYGDKVGPTTPVKIIDFDFDHYELPKAMGEALITYSELTLHADGGSRGNPGPSATGFVLTDLENNVVKKDGKYLGLTTNNQAEYQALRDGLEAAKQIGAHEVHVYMDSLLVVNQMKGIFKVKNRDLWPIYNDIKTMQQHDFKHLDFTHVPREFNKAADAMVNQTLDAELKKI